MKAQTTIRLPSELKEKLEMEAERRGMSFNGLILFLIDKGYQHLQK